MEGTTATPHNYPNGEPIMLGDKVKYYYADGPYSVERLFIIEEDEEGELNIDARDAKYITKQN